MQRILENAVVWDGAEDVRVASMVVDGDTITSVGAAPARPARDVERIDLDGRLAIPGLVNAHGHAYSALARGMSLPGYAPRSFAEILEQLWWRLDKALDAESIRASAMVAALDATRCGVTTVVDHHASPRAVAGSLDLAAGAFAAVGLRAAHAYEVSDRDGPDATREGIAENVRALAAFRDSAGQAGALFGLHAAFTLSDATLSLVATALPDEAGVHIHVAEGPEDETLSLERHGVRVVERLDRFGLVRPRSVLAHCLHLDEREKDLVAERGAIVVHNPRSNMNNAVGTFDLEGFLDRRALVGLGTDGLGTNMLGELFTASLLQKHARRDPLAAGFGRLHRLLFESNPEIAGRVLGVRVGRLAPGWKADIAVLDYDGPTPLDASTVLGHLLFGMSVGPLHVSDVFVGGEPVLRDGRFVRVDEKAELARAREAASRLWQRAREGTVS